MQTKKVKTQRALVLQGGGALGAYEAGVIRTLHEKLTERDKQNGENRLLFDIIAGTSIGAMNGAVLVSEFLKTRNWGSAVGGLERFWSAEEGLASTTLDVKTLPSWKPWKEGWYERVPSAASATIAERYYSVKNFLMFGAQKIYSPPTVRPDFKFFDHDNKSAVYNNDRLKATIEKFVTKPIDTSLDKNEPRLLVFGVDVAEGETITFDSYPKSDGSRKSEYGKDEKSGKFSYVISYPGITIDHVMASGPLPIFYDYRSL